MERPVLTMLVTVSRCGLELVPSSNARHAGMSQVKHLRRQGKHCLYNAHTDP